MALRPDDLEKATCLGGSLLSKGCLKRVEVNFVEGLLLEFRMVFIKEMNTGMSCVCLIDLLQG